MKIIDNYASGRLPVSFEIFPPKGELDIDGLRAMLDGIAGTDPAFISVTCSAGGSGNSANTAKLSGVIQNEYGVTAMAHLTCWGAKRRDVDQQTEAIRAQGIENVLALRGDRAAGTAPGDFQYASELIAHLKAHTGLCIGAGCYPEGHVDCLSPDEDIDHLKRKQDAGADFFVSQLFFENDAFFRFIDRCRQKGITAPIEAGVMPIMGKGQITRMIFLCGASLPAAVVRLLNRYENDPRSLLQAGLDYAAEQLVGLAQSGAADGLHIYSMNKPEVAIFEREALKNAGF